jgi:hypothetical protein
MGLFDNLFGKKQQPPPEKKPVRSQRDELSAKFPFPLVAARGGDAEAELLRLRRELAPSGSCPVIIGEFDSAINLMDLWDEPFDLAAELQKAELLDPGKWFLEQAEQDPELYEDAEDTQIYSSGAAPMMQLSFGMDFKNASRKEVFIATLPTADSTLIPLHLRFGGWNSCPHPHVHVALARHWRECYGAELATMASDVVEFTVTKPPADDAQALELARQQFYYCSDVVHQGVGSVATLAKSLRRSSRWYFWWD